jgi:hypothetical protein
MGYAEDVGVPGAQAGMHATRHSVDRARPALRHGPPKHKVFRFTVSVTITVNEMNFFWVSGSIPRWDYTAFVFGCSPLCPR